MSWQLDHLDPDEVEQAYRDALKRLGSNSLMKIMPDGSEFVVYNTTKGFVITEVQHAAIFWSEMFHAYMDYCEENYIC